MMKKKTLFMIKYKEWNTCNSNTFNLKLSEHAFEGSLEYVVRTYLKTNQRWLC